MCIRVDELFSNFIKVSEEVEIFQATVDIERKQLSYEKIVELFMGFSENLCRIKELKENEWGALRILGARVLKISHQVCSDDEESELTKQVNKLLGVVDELYAEKRNSPRRL